MRYIFSFVLCFILGSVALAQENPSPYEIALQRIEEAATTIGPMGLDLSNLGLTEVPPEIATLRDLEVLNLSLNQLTTLPVEIGNLHNLQELYLFGNQLDSLPSEIGNLITLQHLDVSTNHLSSLPIEIRNLSNLYTLFLSNNQLSSLPSEIGNLNNLQSLDLSNNQLSSLPAEIGNLFNLCTLNLQHNHFKSIPLELYLLRRLGAWEDCWYQDGLLLDDYLLDTLPDEVVAGGTSAILDYLENEAWWHLQKLIAGGAGSVGLLSAVVLGWRWKNRRGKAKRKNSSG